MIEEVVGVAIASISDLQYDVREDEEQNVKLKESIDLLLAAGYFRARIKGLTPFDKVGVAWRASPAHKLNPSNL